ncbi:RagB/SusD family nutrient uptake outer membrane protein [Mucilaginibacter terrae]|uniref:SusD-like N-terminal domain-containing protein n=1 Tax=Mucilaginibacter terrae TaxID=1955052 RepID=A0ABU3GR93_9SPHI|nr:RagB/SusD family nutrient uptake outer membrane protein [Mucilaginibacter terrae]MDT3402300.1 hypothetical protein [Mucilaginibacter terrae]
MKHHSLTYYLTLLLVCSCLWSSCKKFVDAGSPKAELTTDKVFADSTGATAAVTGIYITPGIGSGSTTVAAGLSADELSTTAQGSYAEFFANNIRPANSQNRSLWVSTYQQLYQANACIEGIMASPGLSDQQKKRLTAEARFIRAFLLFNLTGLFGPVPLVTMTDYRETRTLPRAATTAVYAQVVADLQFAQANLSSQGEDTRRGNYYAATALLARVYLYLGQYAQAAAEASKVIDSGHFSLMAEPNQVFLATSKEAIWAAGPGHYRPGDDGGFLIRTIVGKRRSRIRPQ